MKNSTIAAISTPIGNGAINIIRMSGDACLSISKKVFYSDSLDYENITARHMYLGNFKTDNGNEKCLFVFFKAPNSYTGEDLVEFQCHGGEFLAKKILTTCLLEGAVLSEPGEFSKRAFLNGKLSLDEAEGIIDVISAESDAELKAGYQLVSGKLKTETSEIQDILTRTLAEIEVSLDYPEHDMEEITNKNVEYNLNIIGEKLDRLLNHSKESSLIKTGINIVLVGKPNVGKSSILNSLLGEERAIVTNIAGTTRDILKETIIYNGIKFNLIDTAGLRESEDVIEKIGISKTKKAIDEAGIILFVLDNSEEITKEELAFYELIKNKNHLIILNKNDKKNKAKPPFSAHISVSAKKNENIEEIKELLYKNTIKDKLNFEELILTNIRHITHLQICRSDLEKTIGEIGKISLDLLAFRIKTLWNTIGKITGETESDLIINEIFSRFCLGK